MKALEKVRAAGEFLLDTGIDYPLRDAELIVAHCLGISRMNLFRDDPEIGEDVMALIETSLRRRAQREPLQYIIGYTEFLGLIIRVGPGVLIPRPETELLVEEATKKMRALKTQSSKLRILDLCTGSGCIALALAKEFPDADVYGTDTSETAIHCAEENARMNAVQNTAFLRGPLFEPVQRNLGNQTAEASFDLIISNPPYIRTNDIKTLQPEIKDWEPVDALNGGEDGLGFYRTIIPEAKRYLKREGSLIFEIGIDQSEAVREIARTSGYEHNAVRKDYAGIERIITIWRLAS
jgi:release factor glutamine methyltransferase